MEKKAQNQSLKNLRSGSQTQDSPKQNRNQAEKTDKGRDPKQTSITEYQSDPDRGPGEEVKALRKEVKAYFEELDRKMASRFSSIDSKFTGIFESLKGEVAQLRTEVTESKEETAGISAKVSEIERSLEFQAEELRCIKVSQTEGIEKAKSDLNQKISELNSKLLLLEKHDRKYNLLFYGIQEEPGEDVIEKLKTMFINDLEIDEDKVESMYFAHGHRLPSRGQGPKPIILRFISYEDRELVLSNARKLVGSRRRILVDLPEPMKIERNRLAKRAYDFRKKDQLQTRIRDKGLEVYIETRKLSTDSWVKRVV